MGFKFISKRHILQVYIFIFFLAVPQMISFYWFQEPLIINEILITWGHSKFGVFLYLLYTHTHTFFPVLISLKWGSSMGFGTGTPSFTSDS